MIEADLPPPETSNRAAGGRRGAVKFDRLLLDGFKSFADRASIDIEPGLTGIVGPNGCGKSNLLEALKWALGETSARRMRGAGMDDVIFGGTDKRPPRNTSEVTLLLDNRLRSAPPEINDADTLQVTRRIERGQGTSYKVNGRGARLRDVQILFSDNASGAGSSAIVSQGRVAALINAKASDRRSVLEEAAGVSGLTARRHDTDLKLKQAEQNLERAKSSVSEVENQTALLRRQARQLQRFKEIDGNIRVARAIVLLIRLERARADLQRANAEHEVNEARMAEAILAAQQAGAAREAAILALQPLRERRSITETDLARATAKLESIENEAARRERDLQDLQGRLVELATDRSREDQNIDEAQRAVARLGIEKEDIAAKRALEAAALEASSDLVDQARAALDGAEASVTALTSELSTREASRTAATRQKQDVERRVLAIDEKLRRAQEKLDSALKALPDEKLVHEEIAAIEQMERDLEAATKEVGVAEALVEKLRAETEAAAAGKTRNEAQLVKLRAEAGGLQLVVTSEVSKSPVSAGVRIAAGYETAVAAAFGDALNGGTDATDRQWWGEIAGLPPRPWGDRRTLADVIDGVDQLQTAARAVAVVEADTEVDALAAALGFGTLVVSRSGYFVRWDGFRGRPAHDAIEAGLRRAARLREIQGKIAECEQHAPALASLLTSLQEQLAAARATESAARSKARGLADQSRSRRDVLNRTQRAGEDARRAVAIGEVEVTGVRSERQGLLQDLAAANNALAEIPADDEAKRQLAEARLRQQQARETDGASRIAHERLVSEQAQRRVRLEQVIAETSDWERRWQQARQRREDLSRRDEEAQRAFADLQQQAGTPAEIIAGAREAMEAARIAAADAEAALSSGEHARERAEDVARGAEGALGELRTARANIIAAISAAQSSLAGVIEATTERLSATAEDLPAIAGLDPAGPFPDLAVAERNMHRLEAEKESFGPVNFLAETELAEQEARLKDMEKGAEEVRQAIERLRQAIKEIEEEARTKLEEAFRTIDRHFGELFSQLFGGGEAHLRLVGTDVLEAGLEIYASPPGKRLQILSLLSGGEQTLTAMALIFAAFLSNPSPICVLDEADAALDDSNTDRLIRLVETMARGDATRFLVITHSPLTMARMDRLYGVTMAERGVSSCTRVDLSKAVEIAEE